MRPGFQAPTGWWRVHYRNGAERLVQGPELEKIQAKAAGARRSSVVGIEIAKLHTCTICGREGPWGPEWEWFGSWLDLDAERPIDKICSPACRAKHKPRRRSSAETSADAKLRRDLIGDASYD